MTTKIECPHLDTGNKFGGEILCYDCNIVIGWWKDPQPRINITFKED